MIKVEIVARNFTYGQKIFGTGGTYPVDEKTARWMVNNGKAKVVHGKLSAEADEFTIAMSNEQFMSFVKANALEIIKVISDAARSAEEGLDTSKVEMSANMDVNRPGDQSNEPSTGVTTSSQDETASEGTMDSSDDEPDISESFPGREILANAGITKVSQIPIAKEKLMEFEGMTSRLANQIGVKLSIG